MRSMAKLEEYKRKRHFDKTPEPSGDADPLPSKSAQAGKRKRLPNPKLPQLEIREGAEHGDTFVVQKHSATRLHYDFRLAIDGTLKSWAVPKGPSQRHADKRLAVMTEDHPLDYANFEGTIPEGNYGAGTVMVWDLGSYEVSGRDPLKALKSGKLHLTLRGKKLKGEWTLVRMRPREHENKPQWLLLKSGD